MFSLSPPPSLLLDKIIIQSKVLDSKFLKLTDQGNAMYETDVLFCFNFCKSVVGIPFWIHILCYKIWIGNLT